MSEENNVLEWEQEYDILTLEDEDGVEHQFELADSLEYKDQEYVALIPVFENAEELLEDSGELVIMKIVEEDGEEFLDPVVDDEEYNLLGEMFARRLEDYFEFEEEEADEE